MNSSSQGSGCSIPERSAPCPGRLPSRSPPVPCWRPSHRRGALERAFPAGCAGSRPRSSTGARARRHVRDPGNRQRRPPSRAAGRSGATDVMLPPNRRRQADPRRIAHSRRLRDHQVYRLADGSLRTQKFYGLRSLQVGTLIVRDIPCTISSDGARAVRAEFLARLTTGRWTTAGTC